VDSLYNNKFAANLWQIHSKLYTTSPIKMFIVCYKSYNKPGPLTNTSYSLFYHLLSNTLTTNLSSGVWVLHCSVLGAAAFSGDQLVQVANGAFGGIRSIKTTQKTPIIDRCLILTARPAAVQTITLMQHLSELLKNALQIYRILTEWFNVIMSICLVNLHIFMIGLHKIEYM